MDESFILPCIKVDDELISVITDVEENEEGTILALPGFLSALPMEVRRFYKITSIFLSVKNNPTTKIMVVQY